MTNLRIELPDEAATCSLGQKLAGLLQPGDALCLSGDLGAGKSTLARALIRALTHPEEEVPSPTFTLVQTYEGPFDLSHFDLYRLTSPDEVFELGLEEALLEGVTLIEWPERLGSRRPADRLDIVLEVMAGGGRSAMITGYGRWKDVML